MTALFPDSNLFLQCKGLNNLPWHEISDGEDIQIIITRPLMEEIDRLKQDGNKRRAKKARKANSFLKDIIRTEEESIEIRGSNPSVILSFLLPESRDQMDECLDLSTADDRIVNEALSFRSKSEGAKIKLFTHDTNPMLTAKNVGLEFIEIPEEWLLEPEPDKRDKIIEKLEEEINELKKNCPEIGLSVKDFDDNEIQKRFDIHIITYEKLSSDKIKNLIVECQNRGPIRTDFKTPSKRKPNKHLSTYSFPGSHIGVQWRYKPPNENIIKKYSDEEYPMWLEELEEYFENFHSRLENFNRVSKVNFYLINSGNVPSENVIVEINALGGIFFLPEGNKKNRESKNTIFETFPKPPFHPKGKWIEHGLIRDSMKSISLLNSLGNFQDPIATLRSFQNDVPNLSNFSMPKGRDRNSFYWKNGKPSTFKRSWIFECEEFRHKIDPEIFGVGIVVPDVKKLQKAAVHLRVTAKNMPQPLEFTLPIRITYEECDTEAEAIELIKNELPVLNLEF